MDFLHHRNEPVESPRGIYWELFHGHRVYYAVTSRDERLPFVGVPIGMETERDVIGRLAECLDVADPLAAPSGRPALRLVRP